MNENEPGTHGGCSKQTGGVNSKQKPATAVMGLGQGTGSVAMGRVWIAI
jgi:hypothetical protein